MKKIYIRPVCILINMEPVSLMQSTITRPLSKGSSGWQQESTSDPSSPTGKTKYGSQFEEQVGEDAESYFGSGSLISSHN